jgi:heat shock protein HtpX
MNTLKTTVLLAALTGLLVGMGYIIGGIGGMVLFFILAGVMNFIAYWFSDKMALRMAGAHEIKEENDPRLFAMVREVAELSKMPMPRVYVVQNDSPNAFATGRDPKHAVVAVTTGIQRLLTERELRGVLGHEMGHVKNRDILTSSIVATIAGAIQMIAQVLLFSSIFGGRDNENRNPLLMLVAILIAPIAATLLQLGISRQREYAADVTGAEVTGDPEALASALEKLQRGVAYRPMEPTPAQEAVSALYIVKPFAGGAANLFSTHPPLEERIRRLRAMRVSPRIAQAPAGGANTARRF